MAGCCGDNVTALTAGDLCAMLTLAQTATVSTGGTSSTNVNQLEAAYVHILRPNGTCRKVLVSQFSAMFSTVSGFGYNSTTGVLTLTKSNGSSLSVTIAGSSLPAGASGQVLTLVGTTPTWANPAIARRFDISAAAGPTAVGAGVVITGDTGTTTIINPSNTASAVYSVTFTRTYNWSLAASSLVNRTSTMYVNGVAVFTPTQGINLAPAAWNVGGESDTFTGLIAAAGNVSFRGVGQVASNSSGTFTVGVAVKGLIVAQNVGV